jgi:ornithine cyclodeaminase/alanine dehydrogenase-like protein (mu-crystallin family)
MMREGDDRLIQNAAIVAVDKSDAARASGEIALPLASGTLDGARLREIGAILNGASAGRTAVTDITVFKSVGIAAQDLATAAMVVERALERGKGTHFDLGLGGFL